MKKLLKKAKSDRRYDKKRLCNWSNQQNIEHILPHIFKGELNKQTCQNFFSTEFIMLFTDTAGLINTA